MNGRVMVDTSPARRIVIAAAAMVIVGQLLAIANDVYLRQSDPSDIVMLGILVVLSAFLLRRARWARWTTLVLVVLGGVLELAGFALLLASKTSPGFWPGLERAVPALSSLRTAVLAFTASPAFPLLAASVLVSGLLDLVAAAMLTFPRSVRSFFSRHPSAASQAHTSGRRGGLLGTSH